jgi:hypothetical protein
MPIQVAQGDRHASLRTRSHLEVEANETFGPGRVDVARFRCNDSFGQPRKRLEHVEASDRSDFGSGSLLAA